MELPFLSRYCEVGRVIELQTERLGWSRCFRGLAFRAVVIRFLERERHYTLCVQVMVQCEVIYRNVDEHHKSTAETRSWCDWHVAWRLVRDAFLALLYDEPRGDAVLSVLLCPCASGLQQSYETDGWFGSHSGLHPDDFQVTESAFQSPVRDKLN